MFWPSFLAEVKVLISARCMSFLVYYFHFYLLFFVHFFNLNFFSYLDDEALVRLIKALIALSNESLEVAYNNREPSLVCEKSFKIKVKSLTFFLFQFALVKLLETGLVNLRRINLIWELVTQHLIEGLRFLFALKTSY